MVVRSIQLLATLLAGSGLIAVGPCSAEQIITSFVVPAVTVRAGDMLTDAVVVERRLVGTAIAQRTHFTSRESVVGKVARRTLPAGAAIPLNAVGDAQAFKEGDRVTLEFRSGGLSIKGAGVALQQGVPGRAARVRNLDTGSVVTGTVRSDGTVEVGGG
jgi:flagella basal body P-ring formation protein FlgA